jgi:hypothetical protein
LTTFVKAGNHLVTYHRPFYGSIDQELEVKGRRFMSAFFPRKEKTSQELKITDLDGLLKYSFTESSKWVQIPVRSAFPRPTLLRNTAEDLVSQWALLENEQKTLILRWAQDIFALACDEASFNEIQDVWAILRQAGLPIDLNFVTAFDFKGKRVSFDELLNTLANDPQEEGNVELNNERVQPPLVLLGNTFRYAVGGSYVMGNNEEFDRRANFEYYPHRVSLQGFYYMPNLVLEREVAALPNALSAVAGHDRLQFASESAKFITLDVAESYVQYLNQELIRQGKTNLVARLITETEWEYLARQNLLNIDGYEWTGDSYFIYRYVLYPQANGFYSPFRSAMNVVRGYSKEVGSVAMKINERGSAMAGDASPYIGFRVVLTARSF